MIGDKKGPKRVNDQIKKVKKKSEKNEIGQEGPKTMKKKKKTHGAGWPAGPRAYAGRTRASILATHILCGPARSNPFKCSPLRTGLNGPGWPVYPLLLLS